jgi:hypothetical protein
MRQSLYGASTAAALPSAVSAYAETEDLSTRMAKG